MLSPSDFNSAVPQFTNGNYASNPVNPQYIAEPSSADYNRGAEPLQTLPAQWWNWFLNKFTSRFNKLNVYVKNIFNELSQLLSLAEMTPDGTEGTPTVEQLKTMFACCYPSYVKGELGLGTASEVNTGIASGCIPLIGCTMGTTDGNIVVTDTTGKLKPSGTVLGTASGCDASCFRPSTWTPTTVTNACKVWKCMATANSDRQLLLGEASESNTCGTVYVGNSCKATFNPGTGVLTAKTFCGSLSGTATTATCVVKTVSGASQAGIIYFCTNCTNADSVSCARTTCICGANGYYYGNVCGNVCGLASRANYSTCLYNRQTGASKVSNVYFYTGCTNASCTATNYTACICGANGYFYGNVCGCLCGTASNAVSATKASQDSSGCTFGTAARYACGCFLSATGCATDSAKLAGCAPSALCVACAGCATYATSLGCSTLFVSMHASVGSINLLGSCNGSFISTSVDHATKANYANEALTSYSLSSTSVYCIKNDSSLCNALFCGECRTQFSANTTYSVCFCTPTIIIKCNSDCTVSLCYMGAGCKYSCTVQGNCTIDYMRNCFDAYCMPWIRFI